jgi:hypothetical protein
MVAMDYAVYITIFLYILVIIWMIWRFMQEWPNYSRKNNR